MEVRWFCDRRSGWSQLLVAAHHITEDPVVATAEAIKAGCDSDDAQYEINISLAVKRGLLETADVDRALARVLGVGFRLGACDPPEMNPYSKISANVIRSLRALEAIAANFT